MINPGPTRLSGTPSTNTKERIHSQEYLHRCIWGRASHATGEGLGWGSAIYLTARAWSPPKPAPTMTTWGICFINFLLPLQMYVSCMLQVCHDFSRSFIGMRAKLLTCYLSIIRQVPRAASARGTWRFKKSAASSYPGIGQGSCRRRAGLPGGRNRISPGRGRSG